MLGQCARHGYYRGDDCPLCHEDGRKLLSDVEIERVGRVLAGVLRHFPDRFNLELDEHGWVDIGVLLDALREQRSDFRRYLKRHHIVAMATTDEKGRYQVEDDRVRATYGHSFDVNLDDLPESNLDVLYFPASEEELDVLLEKGLTPKDRKMVHLSSTMDRAYQAGLVHTNEPFIIEVDASAATRSGITIHKAGKEVHVTSRIAPEHISEIDEDSLNQLADRYGGWESLLVDEEE